MVQGGGGEKGSKYFSEKIHDLKEVSKSHLKGV